MGDFKFLGQYIPDEPAADDDNGDAYNELYAEEVYRTNLLSTGNRPAVFLCLDHNRDAYSDQEWNGIIRRQRTILINHLYDQGFILHTIVSQDDNGLTLRTEILS